MMVRPQFELSTGLPGLDQVFQGLRPGDSIVWQIDSISDYLPFIEPYAEFARENDQKVIYFRFAKHDALLDEQLGIHIHYLRPEMGFEPFIQQLHNIVDTAPPGTFYVFDCLSGLAAHWQSDRMLGNFFILASEYFEGRNAIAYFALFRDYHSFHAGDAISRASQILVNVYRRDGKLYIHPIKADRRYSGTLFTLHVREGDEFIPVTQSCVTTEILSDIQWSRLGASAYTLGYWSKTFTEAENAQLNIRRGIESEDIGRVYFHKLLHMLISHDEQVLQLADKYFTLQDLLDVRKRMIGTGRIGGKAVGMLLARAILSSDDPRWKDILEVHDSFYVGSDVFYTYLVSNGYWWLVKEKKDVFRDSGSLESIQKEMLGGTFPDSVIKQFSDMLDYFGQSPIIVRSSSLLEDAFGNAFAGKYESVFCANQGPRQERLNEFLTAVRRVYSSVMSEVALAYRSQHELLDREEQMALLIQRVSGSTFDRFYYPQAAGVGFSFNPYVWHKDIDPEAGMLRLVFGLGTRAVDRNDDDYTRIVALNAPTRRPETNLEKVREYAQRQVDVLDLEANELVTRSFVEIAGEEPKLPLDLFASKDRKLERKLGRQQLAGFFPWVLTFDKFLSDTNFVTDMREMLGVLRRAYDYPVDIEFTVNFLNEDCFKINLVQCRPLQVWGAGTVSELPEEIPDNDIVFQSQGPVIGRSRLVNFDWVIYVVPSVYGKLPVKKRHSVARAIGELTNHESIGSGSILLVGPGRWGTTSPELGVPVSFAEIHNASVLCEIVTMHEKLVPDVSLGTHFFNELVENDMLYLAVFPDGEESVLKEEFFTDQLSNHLSEFLPEQSARSEVIKLLKLSELPEHRTVRLNADTISQRVVCYKELWAGATDENRT